MSPRDVREKFLDGVDSISYEAIELWWSFGKPMEDDFAVRPGMDTTARDV